MVSLGFLSASAVEVNCLAQAVEGEIRTNVKKEEMKVHDVRQIYRLAEEPFIMKTKS